MFGPVDWLHAGNWGCIQSAIIGSCCKIDPGLNAPATSTTVIKLIYPTTSCVSDKYNLSRFEV